AVITRWFAAGDGTPRPAGSAGGSARFSRLPRRLRQALERVFDPRPIPADRLTPTRRAGLMALFLVLFGFTITGHQLTPFFAISAVGALVLVVRVRWPSLPVLMGVMIAAWVAFVAVAFLIGHFQN